MSAEFNRATYSYRDSDKAILIIMVATIVSSMWVTFWSLLTALGSGLASTPESRVPHASNVLWWISGYAFFACIALFLATLITRKRPIGIALGMVVLGAGLALTAGRVIDWHENNSAGRILQGVDVVGLVIPIIASAVIFWTSRELLPWGPIPDTA